MNNRSSIHVTSEDRKGWTTGSFHVEKFLLDKCEFKANGWNTGDRNYLSLFKYHKVSGEDMDSLTESELHIIMTNHKRPAVDSEGEPVSMA